MEDIVTRLRNGEGFCINDYASCPFTNCENCAVVLEAADEIERLREENERLRQALWDCAIIAGEDPDGSTTPEALTHPDIDVFAYRAVLQLREENKRFVSLQKVLDLLYEHD